MELNKQSLSILEDKLKVASESDLRLRAELAAEKKASEDKLADARAQARSEVSDRDTRLKDITQQLDQARADVFAAKNEAESFRFVRDQRITFTPATRFTSLSGKQTCDCRRSLTTMPSHSTRSLLPLRQQLLLNVSRCVSKLKP
jgi:hypothetical protein